MRDIIVHPNPAWGDSANFIIRGRIDTGDSGSGPSIEQLWARQIDEFQFVVCCIPFFVYNLALGDVVTTGTFGEDKYVIDSVVEKSGRFVFRAWLSQLSDVDELSGLLTNEGCLVERPSDSSRLLALDAATEQMAQRIADILQELEDSDRIHYETGSVD